MNSVSATQATLDVSGLPGIVRVEDASNDKPAMHVIFAGGVKATITRALVNRSLFDMWLPSDDPTFAAAVPPNVDEATVMCELTRLATVDASTN